VILGQSWLQITDGSEGNREMKSRADRPCGRRQRRPRSRAMGRGFGGRRIGAAAQIGGLSKANLNPNLMGSRAGFRPGVARRWWRNGRGDPGRADTGEARQCGSRRYAQASASLPVTAAILLLTTPSNALPRPHPMTRPMSLHWFRSARYAGATRSPFCAA
jgi:hypothetical protein